jgi:hypothetical protein
MEIVRYDPSLAEAWNETVRLSRNGHFQFLRPYMDYHADRFPDASYLESTKDGGSRPFPATGKARTAGPRTGDSATGAWRFRRNWEHPTSWNFSVD